MREPRDDQSLFIGFPGRNSPEDVFGDRLARLDELSVISLLDLPEYLGRPLDGGRRNRRLEVVCHAG
jgi:hypothetical protein